MDELPRAITLRGFADCRDPQPETRTGVAYRLNIPETMISSQRPKLTHKSIAPVVLRFVSWLSRAIWPSVTNSSLVRIQADPVSRPYGLTIVVGTATAVNSLDETQNSGSTEYPGSNRFEVLPAFARHRNAPSGACRVQPGPQALNGSAERGAKRKYSRKNNYPNRGATQAICHGIPAPGEGLGMT